MILLREKKNIFVSTKEKKDGYHSSQISNAIIFFSCMSLCILIFRTNIYAYKHVGNYVIDLHEQIKTACFLSLGLAGMIPE